MWSRDLNPAVRRLTRFLAAATLAAATAACFQPLYGERNAIGGSSLSDALAAVEVVKIDAPQGTAMSRIAIETRNELVFELTGGSGQAPPTHRLIVKLSSTRNALIRDVRTGREEFENFGLDANYSLTRPGVPGSPEVVVATGTATTRVTYNIPGAQQRFARTRALRDAETQAAKQIAEQIRSRLASYFVAGT
jgi:LPS-assembly lipoprotein